MTLQNDDLLLVNRGGTSFKAEYGLLKQNINEDSGISVSEDAPTDPSEGDLWYNSDDGRLYVWYVNETTGVVTDVSVRNGGSGYNTSGTDVSTDGGSGSELTIDYQAGVGGTLANPTVNQGGHAYEVNDVVFVTGSGHANSTVNITAVNAVAVGQWVDASPDGGGGGTTKTDIYGTAKAWGVVESLGSLNEGYNVSSTRTADGSYTITFDTPLTSSNYTVVISSIGNSNINTRILGNQTVNGFEVRSQDVSGNFVNIGFGFTVHDLEPVTVSGGGGGTSYWDRSGTTLSPENAGDSVDIGSGNITLNADGSQYLATRLDILKNSSSPITDKGVRIIDGGGAALISNDGPSGSSTAVAYQHNLVGNPYYRVQFDGTTKIGNSGSATPTITLNTDGSASFGGNVISTGRGRFDQGATIGFTDSSLPNPATGTFHMRGTVVVENIGSGTGSTVKYNLSSGRLIYDASSRRYKDNIRDSDVGLAELMQLRPVKFEYKESGASDIGFIAEEVYPVVPEYVGLNEEGEPESVNYDRMVSVLTKALQESVTRIEALEAEVQAIKGGN